MTRQSTVATSLLLGRLFQNPNASFLVERG
jgi:hypothetical protein